MGDKIVKSENVCACCGKELPTESGRIICKECEDKYKYDKQSVL